jgi:thiol-disulfide isomerase/thioredoxin
MNKLFLFLLPGIFSACTKPGLIVHTNKPEKGTVIFINSETNKTDTVKFNNFLLEYSPDIKSPTVFKLYFDKINPGTEPCLLMLSKETTKVFFDSLVQAEITSEIFPLTNRPHFTVDPNSNSVFIKFHDRLKSFSDSIMLLSGNNAQLDSERESRKTLYLKFILACDRFVSENKSKPVAGFIINYLINNDLLEQDKILEYYSGLDSSVRAGFYGEKILKVINLFTGNPAPDFAFKSQDGRDFGLSDFKGKKLLLHFWSSTCGPCLIEMPQLVEFSKIRKEIPVVNISLDVDSILWISKVKTLGLSEMINVCDFKSGEGDIYKAFNSSAIPQYFLIDENGLIICKSKSILSIKRFLK